MKANLMLHCGANRVEREALELVPTPMATKTWQPIPHGLLLRQVVETLTGAGLNVVTEAFGMTRDGNRFFGLLQVAGQNEEGGDYGLVVGLRNSHDKSFPAGLVAGAQAFVCDNLSFSSEIRIARKHTVNIVRDLPALVGRAVGQLGQLRCAQEHRFLTYKAHEVSDKQAHDLIIRSLDAGIVPVTKIPDLLKQWREPNYPEFRQGKTVWRLFQSFTENLKGNLDLLPRRTICLHGLLDLECGLIDPTVASQTAVALAG